MSDIHFVSHVSANHVLGKVRHIAAACVARNPQVDAVIIVISGDIAFSGHPDEYEHAHTFVSTLHSELHTRCPGVPIHVATCPGNHDLDFTKSGQARDMLINSLREAPTITPDSDTFRVVTGPQHAYFNFVARLDVFNNTTADDVTPLLRRHSFRVAEKTLHVWSFNTSWTSAKDEQNTLLYREPEHNCHASESTLSIAIGHHPIGWFEPENGKLLTKCLQKCADLVLIGHEHEEGMFAQGHLDHPLPYVKGGVLQAQKSSKSSFHVIDVDLAAESYEVSTYEWDAKQDLYALQEQGERRTFVRNVERLRRDFAISTRFEHILENINLPLSHPRKSVVTLGDVYLFPDIRELSGAPNAGIDRANVSHDLVATIKAAERVVLVGPHNCGKTAVCKRLFVELRAGDHVPVLLSGSRIGPRDVEELQQVVSSMLGQQYQDPSLDKFWQLDKTKRALILDDFQLLQLTREQRSRFLSACEALFGLTILVGDEVTRLERLTPSHIIGKLAEYDFYEMLPFGHVLQDKLAAKWFGLRDADNDIPPPDESSVERTKRFIPRFLSNAGIPTYPAYMLMMLQMNEAGTAHKLHDGTYGHLLQSLLTVTLARKTGGSLDFETSLTVLAAFAHYLFTERTTSVTESAFLTFCLDYQTRFGVPVRAAQLLSACRAAHIFGTSDDRVGFGHRFVRHYFVGKYLADKITDDGVQNTIRQLCDSLHLESSASVVLFLSYQSKHPFIMAALTNTLSRMYVESKEADLERAEKSVEDLVVDIPQLNVDDGPPDIRRAAQLERRDAKEEAQIDCWYFDEESREKEEFARQVNPHIARFNAYGKAVQIFGQVLRTVGIQMETAPKALHIREAFELCLRSVGWYLDFVEVNKEQLLKELAWLVEEHNEGILPAEVRRLIASTMYLGAFGWSLFGLHQFAQSFGDEKLMVAVESALGVDDAITNRLYALGAKLNIPGTFPEDEVYECLKLVEDRRFLYMLLRQMVWHHAYLFRLEGPAFRRLCDKFQFTRREQLIDNRQRRSK
ncbi:MAG: metallophosphoesterase [Planctomycetes bacterium]|nr:metallophosphoesterase [Planctomycetota bacterium]